MDGHINTSPGLVFFSAPVVITQSESSHSVRKKVKVKIRIMQIMDSYQSQSRVAKRSADVRDQVSGLTGAHGQPQCAPALFFTSVVIDVFLGGAHRAISSHLAQRAYPLTGSRSNSLSGIGLAKCSVASVTGSCSTVAS